MRRLVMLLLVAAGLVVAAPGAAHACSCVSSAPRAFVARADAVVGARVVDVSTPLTGNGQAHYLLEVDTVYKGRATQRLALGSEASGAACGLEGIEADRRYVFFLDRTEAGDWTDELWGAQVGSWTANLCGGTGMVDEQAMQRLVGPPAGPGAGRPVVEAPRAPDPGGPARLPVSGYSYAGMGAGLVLAVGTGLAWLRRVRRAAR